MNILAIETSCDDTGVAVLNDGLVLSNIVASQLVHSDYGGVVPELASREHLKSIVPVCEKALQTAALQLADIDAVAYTEGPGLLGSLITGLSFAKSIALARQIPLIPVNHLEAHVLAHFIDEPKPTFPFLCLTVSGGHTQILIVKSVVEMEVIGETNDDAVGEAFDKCAKILGLGYPGGVLIDKLAKSGNPKAFQFPIANIPDFNFSFSGVKTAFLYFVQSCDAKFIAEHLPDICASIQHTLVETLIKKLIMAANATGIQQIAIAGGVAANSYLRARLTTMIDERKWQVFIPQMQYCTDNAAMIGIAGWYKWQAGVHKGMEAGVSARLPIGHKKQKELL
jgi:N6-L-threonylcarbamoyladenine synthase